MGAGAGGDWGAGVAVAFGAGAAVGCGAGAAVGCGAGVAVAGRTTDGTAAGAVCTVVTAASLPAGAVVRTEAAGAAAPTTVITGAAAGAWADVCPAAATGAAHTGPDAAGIAIAAALQVTAARARFHLVKSDTVHQPLTSAVRGA